MIKTTERMTYADVRSILEDEDEELMKRYEPLVPMFKEMGQLAQILRENVCAAGQSTLTLKKRKY